VQTSQWRDKRKGEKDLHKFYKARGKVVCADLGGEKENKCNPSEKSPTMFWNLYLFHLLYCTVLG
jgi:hypothetical protein